MRGVTRLRLSSRVVQTDNGFHAGAMDRQRSPSAAVGRPSDALTESRGRLPDGCDSGRHRDGPGLLHNAVTVDGRLDSRTHARPGWMDASVPAVPPARVSRASAPSPLRRLDLPARRPRSRAQASPQDSEKSQLGPRVSLVRSPGMRRGPSHGRLDRVDLPSRRSHSGHHDSLRSPERELRAGWSARAGSERR
jgi:hypothetical protein